MSSSGHVIPKDKRAAYQPWELHSLDEAAGTPGHTRANAASRQGNALAQRQGYDAGYREGMEAARRDAARETVARVQQIEQLLLGVQRDFARFDQELAEDVLQFALSVAQQLLRQALVIRPQLVLPIVQEAIARIGESQRPRRIALNAEDARLVRAQLGERLFAADWSIVEDNTIERGGCRIDAACTQVDATLTTRWQRAAAALSQSGEWLE